MQLEFRDGAREVPDHLASVLIPYKDRLYQITYAEACEFANTTMVKDIVERHMSQLINEHFKVHR